MPAPRCSSSAPDRSLTVTSRPSSRRRSAAVRPPSEPPTTATRAFLTIAVQARGSERSRVDVQRPGGSRPGPDLHVHAAGMEGLPTAPAPQLGPSQLTARAVPQERGWAGLAGGPAIPPGGHREQHVAELQPLLRQHVVVPGRPLRVGPLLQHTLRNEAPEALGQHLARDAQVTLDVVKAGDAHPDVPEDERRPGFSGDLEGAGDRARHLAEPRALHACKRTVVSSLTERSAPPYLWLAQARRVRGPAPGRRLARVVTLAR